MLKFFWNGIKDNGGKLQTVSYSDGTLVNYPAGTITIYKREYSGFSDGIAKAFAVENDSEIMTDYIVTDLIRVEPTHPLYGEVAAALAAKKVHDAKRWAKRAA
jgi:hypothetical protein